MATLHDEMIVIDGLIVANFDRSVFEDMRKGGLTAVNCTCCVWHGFRDTMRNVARWKRWFAENDDILLPVKTTEDIRRAKAENKTGIFLGWQNTTGIEDELDFLRVFKDLGVGVIQLTYNTQNFVGSGCWESTDSGLSDFGREVVATMNDVGIMVDLSHVGAKTSSDAIAFSKKPVAYSHCCPAGLKDHPRNKTDAQLKEIADAGGFIGYATYTPFMPTGGNSTVADCIDGIEYIMNIAGEDQVGIGTDFTQGQGVEFFDYLQHDKGYARRLVHGQPGVPPQPKGLETIAHFGNLTAEMERRRWPEDRIRKVMGENWLRVLKEVWGA